MTDIAIGASAPDDLFASTSKTSSGFAWSSQARPLTARLLKGSLYLFILGQVTSILVLLVMLWAFQIWAQDGGVEDQTVATLAVWVGTAAQFLPFAAIPIFILCVIFYLMFVYRAAKNLELSKARGINVSPGGAVGWSFVPVANLGAIYNAMKEIWVASHDPVKGTRPATARLGLWWGLWLASGIVSRISEAMIPADAGDDPTTFLDQFFLGSMVGIAGSLAAIVSTLILHSIITEIVRAQELMRSTSVFED
jgi:hypothetical protein